MGGGGTIHLGAAHSGIWAALAPMSPAYMGSHDILKDIKVPMMVVTGDKDTVVPVQMVRPFAQKMKEMDAERLEDDVHKEFRLDLCPRCWRTYRRDPLAGLRDRLDGGSEAK